MTQALNLEQIRAKYLRDLQNQNPAAHVHAGSDNHVRATAIAAVGEGQYQHQEWILRQAFADTADSAFLEKHAAKYGIYRKAATFAAGKVRISGASGTTVPIGQQINVGDQVYLTAAAAVIGSGGSVDVPVMAAVSGSSQNQAQTSAVLQSVPAGVDSTAVLLEMVGGTDAETDESLLARYEERLRRPAAGGNQYDFRNWCLEVPGVVDAFIYPLRRGNGFVDAVILGENGIPSEETLAAVQTHVDAVRPVTRKNGFLALAPTIQAADVAVTVTLTANADKDASTVAIKSAVNAYFGTLKPGDTLIKSQLETLISEVHGVIDRVLTTPAGNIRPSESDNDIYWIRPGSITVEYTS
ncbi:baseplate J/gp47 family protein [Neisseria dumasiana]|uniref:Phage tail protein n=1 Tax=Neisseria dumasiana TaxID=1931275 RepID=A0A1X3DLS4_9NEIS|nr:baseplate J/gp47 family protein [Neisseria dumasiana]OSI25055.1 phage tail protein [Neisseria dumasiana]